MIRRNFKITEHLNYFEVIRSQTAIRNGINNEPNEQQLENIKRLAENVFEPLREMVSIERGIDTPLRISSCFRSPELNKLIGGSPTSDHSHGNALDIDIDGIYDADDLINADLFYIIEEKLNFNQLIWEFGTEDNPNWIHVSYKGIDHNKNEILRSRRIDGKTTYEFF